MNSHMHFYETVRGEDGKTKLRLVAVDQLTPEVLARAIAVVQEQIRCEDQDLAKRIAAGSGAKLVFDRKSYAALGYTKEGFCRHAYSKSSRTIGTYVNAAVAYENIGGLGCTYQPTSVNQLDALGEIVRERREEVWLQGFKGGTTPSGESLLQLAEELGARIPKKTTKDKKVVNLEMPCSTTEEAIEFAVLMEKASRTQRAAWSKIRGFLQARSQQDAEAAPKPKRAPKTKNFPVPEGQMALFEEKLVPKTDELAIPQLG